MGSAPPFMSQIRDRRRKGVQGTRTPCPSTQEEEEGAGWALAWSLAWQRTGHFVPLCQLMPVASCPDAATSHV